MSDNPQPTLSEDVLARKLSDLEILGCGNADTWWDYSNERHREVASKACAAIEACGFKIVRDGDDASETTPLLHFKTTDEIIRDAIGKQMAIKDHFVAQYLAATGAKIQDTVLCEQYDARDFTTRYWLEPKGKR